MYDRTGSIFITNQYWTLRNWLHQPSCLLNTSISHQYISLTLGVNDHMETNTACLLTSVSVTMVTSTVDDVINQYMDQHAAVGGARPLTATWPLTSDLSRNKHKPSHLKRASWPFNPSVCSPAPLWLAANGTGGAGLPLMLRYAN